MKLVSDDYFITTSLLVLHWFLYQIGKNMNNPPVRDMKERLEILYRDRQIHLQAPLPSNLLCAICFNLMVDPLQTDRGFVSCSKCYYEKRRNLSNSNTCPLDGELIENESTFTRPDRYVEREITKIKVKCYYKQCSWVGQLGDIMTHENQSCNFAISECDSCGEKVVLKDMKTHQLESCGSTGENNEKYIYNGCPFACGIKIPNTRDLHNHLRNQECTKFRDSPQCPHTNLGCPLNGNVTAENVLEHIQSKHNNYLLLDNITKLINDNKRLEKENKSSKDIINEQSKQLSSMRNEISAVNSKLHNITINFDQKKYHLTKLTTQMEQINQSFDKLKNMDYYDRKVKQLKTQSSLLPSSNHSTTFFQQNIGELEKLRKFESDVKDFEKNQAFMNANFSDLVVKLHLLKHQSSDGRLIWRMDNFRNKIQLAMSGKIVAHHSAPCFTHVGGYKFCIRVYPNGDGMGRNTHLSIYFVLLKSHNDELLQWPFSRKVTFRVLNVRDPIGQSKKEVFCTDTTSSSFQKPKKDMNIAAGCPKFLAKDMLLNNGFLMDDCIFIETIVEEIKMEV